MNDDQLKILAQLVVDNSTQILLLEEKLNLILDEWREASPRLKFINEQMEAEIQSNRIRLRSIRAALGLPPKDASSSE